MNIKLRTISILLGFLMMLAPQAASAAEPIEFEDLLANLEAYSGGVSCADRYPAGDVGNGTFRQFTLIIDYANQRIIYEENVYPGLPASYSGGTVIIMINGNGARDI